MNDSHHQSYLLRLWRDNEDEEWLAALVSIPTQERRNFPSLEALFDYLKHQESSPFQNQYGAANGKPLARLVSHKNSIPQHG